MYSECTETKVKYVEWCKKVFPRQNEGAEIWRVLTLPSLTATSQQKPETGVSFLSNRNSYYLMNIQDSVLLLCIFHILNNQPIFAQLTDLYHWKTAISQLKSKSSFKELFITIRGKIFQMWQSMLKKQRTTPIQSWAYINTHNRWLVASCPPN